MATRLIPVLYQAVDANGDPANGYKLYFYETGTTTLKDTYSDEALTVVNANPVVCNSDGRPASGGSPVDIFGASKEDYKVVLKTDADVTVVTDDPIDTVTYDINSFGTRPAQHWGTTTGTASAFLIKPVPSITAYTSDLFFTIEMSLDNNASSTLAVFQEGTVSTYLSALTMKKYDNAGAKVDLEAGDNQAGQRYGYWIDGTDAVCLNPGKPYLDLRNCDNATTTLKGAVELATDAETATGTDTARPIVPSALLSLFNASLRSSDGYLRIPCNVGGTFVELIVQWGIDTVNISSSLAVSLPLTFPTAALHGIANLFESATGRTSPGYVTAVSTTQITLHNSNSSGTDDDISWIAIGY